MGRLNEAAGILIAVPENCGDFHFEDFLGAAQSRAGAASDYLHPDCAQNVDLAVARSRVRPNSTVEGDS
jgi:hypothetical protein